MDLVFLAQSFLIIVSTRYHIKPLQLASPFFRNLIVQICFFDLEILYHIFH